MTKQKQIDWLIRDFMGEAFVCEDDNYRAMMSKELRQLLKSQGVKFVGELPSIYYDHEEMKTALDYKKELEAVIEEII